MTAGLRMRQRVTSCSFATTNMAARQTYSRRRGYSALRAGGGRNFKAAVGLLQMQAIFCVDLFHMARPYTGEVRGSGFGVQGLKSRV